MHGVDLNPFAVAIARFRLLVAAMAASGVHTLGEAAQYEWPIHLAVGDSLIKHRHKQGNLFDDLEEEGADELAEFKYETEDVHEHPDILRPGRYHVVVGNPPYITVKDKKLNELYRELYRDVCSGKYALSVPFAQRFFELAKTGDTESGLGYGTVGQITANSFMKREFGTRLIEMYFGHEVELTEVIDTSGAFIPGHGTPTVILVGKRRGGLGRAQRVRTVRSVQGEPSTPQSPEEGSVWRAILSQIDEPGSISQWVSVDDLERQRYFGKQPWVLADGGLEMIEELSHKATSRLAQESTAIGMTALTLEDDAFLVPAAVSSRLGFTDDCVYLVNGDEVRDYEINSPQQVIMPRTWDGKERDLSKQAMRFLWPCRTNLRRRLYFGKVPEERGLRWFDLGMFFADRHREPHSITFSFVSRLNHFVLDRGGKVFKQSAPVVKLPRGASEEMHLQLLGLLNSSTACFWLKMVSQAKGGMDNSSGGGNRWVPEQWMVHYEFTGTKLQEFPLPASSVVPLATVIDTLSQLLSKANPSTIASDGIPNSIALRESGATWNTLRSRMVALQEELDWQVYHLYGLHPEDLRVSEDPDSPDIPQLAIGERAFEIVHARRIAAGEASDEWFKRYGATPISEIPSHWPRAYREIVQKRIDTIESSRAIGMVERPEYKRRWATEGWEALQEEALRDWLLDRAENRDYWFDGNDQPVLVTLSRLTDNLSRDEDFVSVAKIYAPHKELPAVVAELMTDEHVPFLPALRYKPAALKKRADWENVWDLQRQEDAAPDEPAKRKIRDTIPVPPKYTSADFLRPSYWRARGKLDVPKERFISYARGNAATPDLYGWAGWDHREQAIALDTYIATHEGLTTEEVTPLLAGLLELQPWLNQWHNEPDPLFAPTPAKFFEGDRQMEQGKHGLTDDDLRAWRPAPATRGRRTTKK